MARRLERQRTFTVGGGNTVFPRFCGGEGVARVKRVDEVKQNKQVSKQAVDVGAGDGVGRWIHRSLREFFLPSTYDHDRSVARLRLSVQALADW